MLNEQSAGSLVALSSMVMLGRASVAGRPSVASLGELKNYLGKTKGEQKLLNNIDVIKMDYIRRDRAELITMRGQFRGMRSKFLKSISDNPEVKNVLIVRLWQIWQMARPRKVGMCTIM